MKNLTKGKNVLFMIVTAIVCAIVPITAGIIIAQQQKIADAFSSSNFSNYVLVGEIWDSDEKLFTNNFSTFLKYISSDGKMSGVSTNANATNIRGYTYNGKSSSSSLVVTLGGFEWQVVYLTTNTMGDKIATLWLRDVNGVSTWSNGFYDSGDNKSTPSNLYGKSYMSAVTLNNGGEYWAYTSNGSNSKNNTYAPKDINHQYALFTVGELGLTKHLSTSSLMSYQINSQGSTYNTTGYVLNNEALSVGGSYSGYNWSGLEGYADWGNDYLWLPSLSEMGVSGTSGIWQVNETERKSSGSSYSWSRSAHRCYSSDAYGVNLSGASYSSGIVNSSSAVRPALHLNLSSAVPRTAPQISVVSSNESQGVVLGTGNYKYGSTYTIIASPNDGYAFDYWMVGSAKITQNPCSMTATENMTITAYFKKLNGLNLSSTTSFSKEIHYGNSYEADYYITPASGNYVYSIQVGTNPAQVVKYRSGILDNSSTSANIHYEINEDGSLLKLSVLYAIQNIDITLLFTTSPAVLSNPASGGSSIDGTVVKASVGGEVRANGFDEANEDSLVHVSALAYSGYEFIGWTANDGTDLSSYKSTDDIPYSLIKGKIVIANFAVKSSTLTNDETNNVSGNDIL